MLWRAARHWRLRRCNETMERPMSKQNDLSRSLVALEQDATLIAVIEMGQSSWLVAGVVPGLDRYPLKKLGPTSDRCCSFCIVGGMKRRERGARSSGSPSPTRRAATASGWRAGCAPVDRSLCDPPVERPGVARAPTGEDGSARHRVAQARLSRLAARRTEALQHGGDPRARG